MKIGKVLQIALPAVFLFGFPASGHAQENLVNLYNWTIVTNWPSTNYITSPPQISITSSNSMNLLAGSEWDPWDTIPGLPNFFSLLTTEVGTLSTTRGAIYKIEFTLNNGDANGLLPTCVTFGNNEWSVLVAVEPPMPNLTDPTNLVFTAVATSETTTMSITAGIPDPGSGAIVSDLTVVALPGITGIAANPNGGIRLDLIGTPGNSYVLESATNLIPPVSWIDVSTNSLGTNGVWQFIDLQATSFAQQYYRLEPVQ